MIGCRDEAAIESGPPSERAVEPSLISASDRRFNFGDVIGVAEAKRFHRYRLTNSTARTVVISKVVNHKTCCGRVDVDKTTLQPGETVDVEVTLLLEGRFGDVVNTVEVVTDAPGDERILLETSATAHLPLRVEAVSLPQGPALANSSRSPTAVFDVFSTGTASEPPIDLNGLEPRSTIPVSWAGEKQEASSVVGVEVWSRRFIVSLDASGAPGARAAEVVFRTQDDALLRHVVDWRVVSPILASPETIVLQTNTRDPRVIITSQDETPFRVTRIECDAAGVQCRAASAEAKPSHIVELHLESKPKAGRYLLSVFTDHPAQEQVDAPVLVLD